MGKKQFYLLAAILLVNYCIIFMYPLFYSRIIRIIITLICFGFYLNIRNKANRFVLYIFLFFLLADVFLFFYETPLYELLTSLSRVVGYLLVLNHFKKLYDHKASDKIAVAVFVILGLINLFGLYLVTNYVYNTSSFTVIKEYNVYVHGLVLIAACFYAGNNNFNQTTGKSLFGAFFIFALAFADLCALVGYYFDFSLFQYIDRTFYVFGLIFLIKYAEKCTTKVIKTSKK